MLLFSITRRRGHLFTSDLSIYFHFNSKISAPINTYILYPQLFLRYVDNPEIILMLSNKEFSKFLAPSSASVGGGSGGGGSDKTRFDLKQVKQWDREIKSKINGKPAKPPGRPVDRASGDATEDGGTGGLYRDRAQERRKNDNVDYIADTMSADRLKSFNIEQSKFLGGDEEHTHLVKGLDYILLQKMRRNTDPTTVQTNTAREEKPLADISTSTGLGAKLKALLISNMGAKSSVTAVTTSMPTNADIGKTPLSAFARLAYEFDCDILSNSDLPTTISRSVQVSVMCISVDFFNI